MPFFSHSWDRDPVDALLRLQDRLERVFEKPLGFELGLSGRGATPPVNVFRDDDGLVIRAEVPGFSPEAIEVESRNQDIVISGKREAAPPAGASAHRRERAHGEFSRSLHVPREFDTARALAKCKNGVLTVRIPLREEVRPRQIEVKTT